MRLGKNWKSVAKRAWSFWLIILAALLSGLEIYIQFGAPGLKDALGGWFAAAAAVISALAAIARLLAQKRIK